MLCIVGHGPSILTGRGALIDQHEVVRLKHGLTPDLPREHFGTRTDYICGTSGIYRQPDVKFWHFPEAKHSQGKWIKYYAQFKPKIWKPSHGLSAVFCAIDHLNPKQIAVIGFDRILYQDDMTSSKWNLPGHPPHPWPHCQRAEHECLFSLGIEIIDLSKEPNGDLP